MARVAGMSAAFWVCAVVTGVSAFVSLRYSPSSPQRDHARDCGQARREALFDRSSNNSSSPPTELISMPGGAPNRSHATSDHPRLTGSSVYGRKLLPTAT